MSTFDPLHNPWTTQSSHLQYDNPWITVTEHKVINPSGNPGIYGQVHFKNIAVGIIPIDEDGQTYIVGQYRYSIREYSWEIPEGGCPENQEDILESAKRELREETGLEAKTWIPILKMYTSNSVTDEVAYTFVARDLTMGEAHPDETEELQVRKMPFESLVELVMKGEVTDAFSVASVLKAKLMMMRLEL